MSAPSHRVNPVALKAPRLGGKELSTFVECDFHTRYPQIAMLEEETGELVERRLEHESGEARAFYTSLEGAVARRCSFQPLAASRLRKKSFHRRTATTGAEALIHFTPLTRP